MQKYILRLNTPVIILSLRKQYNTVDENIILVGNMRVIKNKYSQRQIFMPITESHNLS